MLYGSLKRYQMIFSIVFFKISNLQWPIIICLYSTFQFTKACSHTTSQLNLTTTLWVPLEMETLNVHDLPQPVQQVKCSYHHNRAILLLTKMGIRQKINFPNHKEKRGVTFQQTGTLTTTFQAKIRERRLLKGYCNPSISEICDDFLLFTTRAFSKS